MEHARAGKLGDTIVSFVPTQAHINTVSLVELAFSENLLQGFRQAISFVSQRIDSPSIGGVTISYGRMADILIALMEVHSLFLERSSCATVGERYMGLKRVPYVYKGQRKLTRIQQMVSLLETVVIPYIESQNRDKDKIFIQSYKAIKSLFALLYLLRLSQVSNPLQYIVRIRVVRHFDPPGIPGPVKWKERLKLLPSLIIWTLVYSIQFSQWYFAHQDVLRPKPNSVVVKPPPQSPSELVDLRLCPICRRPRRNPTALISNGTVYCFSCIASKLGPEKTSLLTRRLVE